MLTITMRIIIFVSILGKTQLDLLTLYDTLNFRKFFITQQRRFYLDRQTLLRSRMIKIYFARFCLNADNDILAHCKMNLQ